MGIQERLFSWLLIVGLPIAAACLISIQVIDFRLTEKVRAGLENDHRLEAARINAALDQYLMLGEGVALSPELRAALVIRGTSKETWSTGQRLIHSIDKIQSNARELDSGLRQMRLVSADGQTLGQTAGFSWQPTNESLVGSVMQAGMPAFGDAFLDSSNTPCLGLVVPVSHGNASGTPLGYVMLELELGPVVDLVVAHEGLGETSESHIAQPTAAGDAQFITLLRFKRDAAFKVTVPKVKDKPINWSLESPDMHVVREPDYRQVDSMLAIGTIESTGWGLVVKIDSEEAFAPLTEVKRVIWSASALSALLVILSWTFMVRPLAKRLHAIAVAADRVAEGDYAYSIQDTVADEIGGLATSIDTLATDLERDKILREEAAQALKHQAEHDALTGLFNRKYAHDIVDHLDAENAGSVCSVLFLDLDGFKLINDSLGHHVGDEILVAVAAALLKIVPEKCPVARWGGDEFVIFMPETDELQAQRVAERVSQRFTQSFSTTAGDQILGCSVGVSVACKGVTVADSVELADAQMYASKQTRRCSDAEPGDAISLVRRCLDENRIDVRYLPVVQVSDTGEKKIAGAQAVLRARDEHGNVVELQDVLPLVQETAIGTSLDYRVMSRAFTDLAHWRREDLVEEDFYVSIDVCAQSARTATLPPSLKKWLQMFGLPAGNIVLEMQESAQELDRDVLASIKALGVRLSVGEIGMQSTQLGRLAVMSPDIARVDGVSMLDEHTAGPLPEDEVAREQILFEHLLGLCSRLGMQCVVTGVDSQEQLAQWLSAGVTYFQGAHFDDVLESGQLAEYLQHDSSNPHRHLRKAG